MHFIYLLMFYFFDTKSDITNLLIYFLIVIIGITSALSYLKSDDINPFVVGSQKKERR